jgi:hypothetical protein
VKSLDEEREARQCDLMVRRLNEFRSGEVPIGRAIADLAFLLDALKLAPEDWTDAFREEWSTLEIAYAVALDRQLPLPTARDVDIAEALDNLERLVRLRTELPSE